MLELVWVSEDNLGEGGTTAGVVNNFLDDSLDVAKYHNDETSRRRLTLLSRRNQEF